MFNFWRRPATPPVVTSERTPLLAVAAGTGPVTPPVVPFYQLWRAHPQRWGEEAFVDDILWQASEQIRKVPAGATRAAVIGQLMGEILLEIELNYWMAPKNILTVQFLQSYEHLAKEDQSGGNWMIWRELFRQRLRQVWSKSAIHIALDLPSSERALIPVATTLDELTVHWSGDSETNLCCWLQVYERACQLDENPANWTHRIPVILYFGQRLASLAEQSVRTLVVWMASICLIWPEIFDEHFAVLEPALNFSGRNYRGILISSLPPPKIRPSQVE